MGGSGSIEVQFSGPMPATHSGSIDIQLSGPNLPVVGDGVPVAEASALDSAPVSSGRVTAMSVAATGPTESARSNRLTEAGKQMLGRGVETLGSGLETLGEGVTKLGEVSRSVPLVGAGVARLGEGITSVGESLTTLPKVAATRRGRLLVRSLLVGLLVVSVWIAAIVLIQRRRFDAPDFRPAAERILTQIGRGRAAIEDLYERSSPRFQEIVRKDRFVDDMLDLEATVGTFVEITAVNESVVTRGPTGRIGRVSMSVRYTKGLTRGSVSLHWVDGRWKLLGVGIEVPDNIRITQLDREVRVAACKDPMDPKRCDVYVAANRILAQLRDHQAAMVWDEASDLFQQQEGKERWVQIQREHELVLGAYRRIISVTDAKVLGGVRGSFDVLVEYEHANVRAAFGFIRASKTQPWQLRSLKIVLPMPRIDDDLGPLPEAEPPPED